MTAAKRIAIRAASVIAFDGRGHRLLRDGVVVIEGDSILHVGQRFDGRVDETVDAHDRVLTPGLISTHAHISGSPLDRSFIEDRGNPPAHVLWMATDHSCHCFADTAGTCFADAAGWCTFADPGG